MILEIILPALDQLPSVILSYICHRQKCPGSRDKGFPAPLCLLTPPQDADPAVTMYCAMHLKGDPRQERTASQADGPDMGASFSITRLGRRKAGKLLLAGRPLSLDMAGLSQRHSWEPWGDYGFFFFSGLKTLCKCLGKSH